MPIFVIDTYIYKGLNKATKKLANKFHAWVSHGLMEKNEC